MDLFDICLRGIPLSSDVDINHLASLGEGYSGADIHVVCREACDDAYAQNARSGG